MGDGSSKPELVLIKLGGSLITDKASPDTARTKLLGRLAREISAARAGRPERLVIGHGAGSFGHVAAARHGLGRGPIVPGQLRGLSATQERAARLHLKVIESLLAADAAPFSLAPSSFATASAGRIVGLRIEPLERALGLGLLPVTYGDVVLDRCWGASVCSTETLFLALHARLARGGWSVRRVFWLGETAGVYDRSGATIDRIASHDVGRVLAEVGEARGTDVTGGMLHRLETAGKLARRGIVSWILDGRVPGLLPAALAARTVPGTVVLP